MRLILIQVNVPIRPEIRMPTRILLLLAVIALTGCASAPREVVPVSPAGDANRVGLLVMAHGGSAEWNETVSSVVAPLRDELPTAVAFGMANPKTLQVGLDSLRSAGVTNVAVVRMFISGQSFLEQTEYLLGLSEERPSLVTHRETDPDSLPEAAVISSGLIVATHKAGLMDSWEARDILTERARSESQRPENDSVLLLAHGMGDDRQNDDVVQAMQAVSVAVKKAGFRAVRAETLREDWPEKRAIVERRLRDYVRSETAAGRKVIVVPMRLSGFGPYAEVLTGLEYAPTEGLLPHPAVSAWIRNTASRVICDSGWENPLTRCATQIPTET